jgi:hypothetical protein
MKLLKPLLVVFGLWAATAPAAIYRSLDEQGNVVFSDQPGRGAQRIDLPPVPTYEAPDLRPARPHDRPSAQPAPINYSKLEIRQPAPDATLRDNSGAVSVIAVIEPELGAGHRLQFYLDGQAKGEPGTETRASFSNVDRGAHRVEVAVVNAAGEELRRSESVTFYLHRQSVNSPATPPAAPIRRP